MMPNRPSHSALTVPYKVFELILELEHSPKSSGLETLFQQLDVVGGSLLAIGSNAGGMIDFDLRNVIG
jgi:hypothetical protein